MAIPHRLRVVMSIGLVTAAATSIAPAQATRPAAPATKPAGLAPATRPAALAPATRPATAPAAAPATKPGAAPLTRPGAAPVPPPFVLPPGQLPTMDQVRTLFEQGNYPETLKQIKTLTDLRGKAAVPYDRYELLMLRVETQLRMKTPDPAARSADEAATATDDRVKAAQAKALALLIRKSRSLAYTPGLPKKQKLTPIDIVDPDSRRKALQALLTDEMDIATPKVDAALNGRSLPAIADALKAVGGLDELELGVGGGEEARRMVVDLRTRGLSMMAKTVQVLAARTEEVAKAANTQVLYNATVVENGVPQVVQRYRKQGLSIQDRRGLQEVYRTADALIPNIRGLAEATGGKVREVEDLIVAAEELRHKADRVLNADYGI